MTSNGGEIRREIRSYVVRAGRVTDAQQRAMQELWPRYGIDLSADNSAPPLQFDSLFGRSAPRVLEIGFGNGDNLAALAEANPGTDFLGAEVHPPGVGHLLRVAAEHQLQNLRVLRHDAVDALRRAFADGALDGVVILFPDPWHKKRHNKRRLLQAPFLDLLATRLRPGGTLAIATDWAPYAEEVLLLLNAHPQFRNLAAGGGYSERPAWRVRTRFERRGERLGHEVHDLLFERR